MILSNTKTLIYSLALLLCSCGTTKPLAVPISNEVLFSPIPEVLEVFQGTSTKIFLSAIDDHLENVQFTVQKSEDFLTITNFKNGSSEVHIAAPKNKEGIYPIQIQLTNGAKSSLINFKVHIKPAPQQIYYCDPSKIAQTGNGSYTNPFPSLQQLMASDVKIPHGALLLLLSGVHGSPLISGGNFTIAAASGQQPILESIHINNGKAITISGLSIGKECTREKKDYLVSIDSLSANITIQNCWIASNKNTKNWTAEEWHTKAANGILCQGKQSVIQNNLVQNIFHGIETENEDILIQYNTVDRFSGDAIRNISSNNRYLFNVLKNATLADYYEPNGNHDDLFQSWTYDHPIENIQLNNNIAISCLEPDLPMKSKIVQGLVCFDGFEKNWIVKNNLVLTDHPHGIALYGAENCLVTENIVLRNPLRLFDFESAPWIMINDHKDKRKSIQNVVTNNIVSALNITSDDVETKGNKIINKKNSSYLKDYEGWDFRLISSPSN